MDNQIPDMPVRVIERNGHIDIYMRWTRCSLLPETPEALAKATTAMEEHECGPDCKDHEVIHDEGPEPEEKELTDEEYKALEAEHNRKMREKFDAEEAAPKIYKRVFIREGLRTETHEAPTTLTREDFLAVFTCAQEELLDYLVNGTECQQWLASLRDENLPKMNPILETAAE